MSLATTLLCKEEASHRNPTDTIGAAFGLAMARASRYAQTFTFLRSTATSGRLHAHVLSGAILNHAQEQAWGESPPLVQIAVTGRGNPRGFYHTAAEGSKPLCDVWSCTNETGLPSPHRPPLLLEWGYPSVATAA